MIIVVLLLTVEFRYDIRLATHDEYRDLAASVGITDFKGLSGNPSEIMQSPAIKVFHIVFSDLPRLGTFPIWK